MNTDFLKGFLKNKNNRIIYIIFIIGIVLMLFSGQKTSEKIAKQPALPTEEEELVRIISKIKGVSDVEVMVTYYGSVTDNIVYDTRIREGETDRTAVLADGKAVVAGESYPRVKGVVAVVKGNGINLSDNISGAVCTALNIPDYKVRVILSS